MTPPKDQINHRFGLFFWKQIRFPLPPSQAIDYNDSITFHIPVKVVFTLEESLALKLSNQIDLWGKTNPEQYQVEKCVVADRELKGFHQWVNGKEVIAGFDVNKMGSARYARYKMW